MNSFLPMGVLLLTARAFIYEYIRVLHALITFLFSSAWGEPTALSFWKKDLAVWWETYRTN
jgi:hypothetical protein